MTYREWRDAKQEEFNKLPIFYAFSNDQFKHAMEKRGLTEDDVDKICFVGTGGYCLKTDRQKILDWINRPDGLPELMKDHDFAVDAFYEEMANHELCYNHYQGAWDVCSCFGNCEYAENKGFKDYLKEMGYSDEVVGFCMEAKKKYYKACDENGWW
jgi:hypothetical protein